MSAPTYISFRGSLALLIARVPMGLFLAIAGVKKVMGGVPAFVQGATGTIPSYVPDVAGKAYLHALPFLEIVVGGLIVIGLFGRLAGAVGALMVLSFILAVTGVKSPEQPFQPTVIFLGVMLMLSLTGPGDFSVDAFRRRKVRADKQ
jgi:uncharacterized membrane protein YphA (DoxX/SURF4 family)